MTRVLERPAALRHRVLGTPFTIFCTFYMVAFLLDATEEWQPAGAALVSLVVVVSIYALGVTRWSFLAFLVLSSAYILVVHFPDPGNHNNLMLVCNVFLAAMIVYAARRHERVPDDEAFLALIAPPLRVTLSLVYILAGLHKLNRDFFNADEGCAREFVTEFFRQSSLPGVSPPAAVVIAVGVAVIAWELGGGLALWSRRTQPVMLALSWIGHAVLAQLVFFDFSSLAFALLLTFIPGAYWRVLDSGPPVAVGRFRVDRLRFYVLINVGVAALAGVYFQLNGYRPWFHRWQGLALNVGMLVFLWPIVRQVVRGRPRIPWRGVELWNPEVPKWAALLPVFILFFGLNPYLGLRTAGTFTMFSNLQIEGGESNHLLLGANPLAIAGLQDDAVTVLAIDPRHADREDDDLAGNRLPALEFQKRIVDWREQGLDGLSARFDYDGRVYETADLTRDNPWGVEGHAPIHYLVDFGLVEQSRPVLCRW